MACGRTSCAARSRPTTPYEARKKHPRPGVPLPPEPRHRHPQDLRARAAGAGAGAGHKGCEAKEDRMSYLRLDGAVLELTGEWNLARIADIDAELAATRLPATGIRLDGSRLQTLDTAAALALLARLSAAGATLAEITGLNRSHSRVLELTRAWLDGDAPRPRRRPRRVLAALGVAVVKFGWALHCHLEFLGRSAAALGELARHP